MFTALRSAGRRFLHDTNLKYKFLTINLILVLAPALILFFFLYGRLSNIIAVNAVESEQAIVNQTAGTLEATISQIVYAMDSIASSAYLAEAPEAGDLSGSLSSGGPAEAREFRGNIHTLVDHEFITAVKIYLPEGTGWNGTSEFVEPETEAQGSYWHGIFAGKPQLQSLFCPGFYLTRRELWELGDMAYIRRFEAIRAPDGGCAYIAVYFSSEHLQRILHQNLSATNSVYYLINSRNCVLAASSARLAGTYYMNYDDIRKTIGNTQQFAIGQILGENLYMGYREIGGTDWRLVSVTPVAGVLAESRKVVYSMIYLYLLFVMLALAAALLLSGNMAKRLSVVVERMNLDRDKMPVKFENNTDQDEIGQLVNNYNLMVDRLTELIDDQTRTAGQLRVSEVKALQAQINPHFLYNMLDMVNWLAKSGQSEKVSIAVQTLSKFYKLTLSKKNITIPIREELDHVELFVRLQNMRFENKIKFIIDVPDEIMDYEIPKLVLQPIVENAIQHGVFEKEDGDANVLIMAWMEGTDIVFVVSDTGVGIKPERLAAILDGTQESERGSNIGIYNTHQRLRYLYGEDYGLHYESVYGQGTEVQVRIPAIAYQEEGPPEQESVITAEKEKNNVDKKW